MQHYVSHQTGRTIYVGLRPGDLVVERLIEVLRQEGIRTGVVISGIGTLDICTLHMVTTVGYPPIEHFERWINKPLELAGVQGVIADGIPHLHAIVSDREKAYAGHLEMGCRVLYLAEFVIQEATDLHLVRRPDENGINLLQAAG